MRSCNKIQSDKGKSRSKAHKELKYNFMIIGRENNKERTGDTYGDQSRRCIKIKEAAPLRQL